MLYRKDLVDKIHERTGLKKKDIDICLQELPKLVTESLCDGEEIRIFELGKFYVIQRKERNYKSPTSGEVSLLPATVSAKFKVSKKLTSAVRQAKIAKVVSY